ncbi:MAG: hypothetical protein J2P47_07620, partial [Acetobacteraceae bacterium]|nr:hypothetical protein [Acetobacteraceae bacterium]
MSWKRIECWAWTLGGAGSIGSIIGWIVTPPAFPHAWLSAVVCWAGWPLGSLALLLIHALTGGRWGWTIRAPLIAGLATLPLVVPFVIPLLFMLSALYPWLRPDIGPQLASGFYLNLSFFCLRGTIYLALWLGLAVLVLAALRRDAPQIVLYHLAPTGLIVLAITVTFAAIDATMSLDPAFKSSAFGMIAGSGAVLFALSIALLMVSGAAMFGEASTEDLGKLTLGLVILWTYLDFMQMLIVWQSNLPDEAHWYLPRISGGWLAVALLVALLHFVLPFFLLIWPQVQRSARSLLVIAVMLVLAQILRTWWIVLPEAHRGFGLLDALTMIATLGLGTGLAQRAP